MQQFYICKSYAHSLVIQLFYTNNVKVVQAGYTTILYREKVVRADFT